MYFLVSLVTAFMFALTLGLTSAWYMIANGSPLTTGQIGPWTVWYGAGNPRADPYTKAYLTRSGRLPITSTNALYYFAQSDESNDPLDATCTYLIDGAPLGAMWWSMALYDESGRLIPNKANRHSFNRTDVIRRADGSFQLTLSSTARQGNWLPTSERGGLQLVLRIYGPYNSNSAIRGRELESRLPQIHKVGCR